MKRFDFFISILCGVAMGTGYMTSLRFFGPVGLSELLFFFLVLGLLFKNYNELYCYSNNLEGWLKLFLVFSFLIAMPVITFLVYVWGGLIGTAPQYCISFAMSMLLMVLIIGAIRKGNLILGPMVASFSATFLISNLFYLLTNPIHEGVRFTGYSENPNQLLFYLSSLMLLLSIHGSRYLFACLIPISFIGYLSGSDAFVLTLVIAFSVLIYYKLFYINSFSLGLNVFLHGFLILTIFALLVLSIFPLLSLYWSSADEGGARISLFVNAFEVGLRSPIFGWGAGSFSGIDQSFGRMEAHNNFLDLSMQFGFVVPIVLYAVIVFAISFFFRSKMILAASFGVAFLISGLFHFSARHFIFWVEIAVLWTIVFQNIGASESVSAKVAVRRPRYTGLKT